MPVDEAGWRRILRQGAQHSVVVFDDVWDGLVLEAFASISVKLRILITTRSEGLWDNSRTVVLRPGDGVWRDDIAALQLLAMVTRALGRDVLPDSLQVVATQWCQYQHLH